MFIFWNLHFYKNFEGKHLENNPYNTGSLQLFKYVTIPLLFHLHQKRNRCHRNTIWHKSEKPLNILLPCLVVYANPEQQISRNKSKQNLYFCIFYLHNGRTLGTICRFLHTHNQPASWWLFHTHKKVPGKMMLKCKRTH